MHGVCNAIVARVRLEMGMEYLHDELNIHHDYASVAARGKYHLHIIEEEGIE